jgi:putative DNA primase/helicase
MFSDRPDAHLVIPLLQEWLGGALAIAALKREQRRALFPVGGSRTGKTELAIMIKALLGGPIATPSAKEFGERFGLETLYDAVAWIRDDAINEGDRLDPQRFKTVVTGEAIDIDRKNQPVLRDVRLDMPVVLTANSLARVRDSTDAVFNRSIVLTMTNVIDEEAAHAARVVAGAGEQSIGMAIFEREASGMLNWALIGLQRLCKRGFYDIPESVKAAITQYKDDNNPVGEWAREALVADPYCRIARSDLVRAYNGWELEQEGGDEARAHGARWLLPRLRNQIKGLGDHQVDNGTRYITGARLTALGLASWTSYGAAMPKHGPGGVSTSASEVNRPHKMGPR